MMHKYTFWLKAAAIMQVLTGVLHTLSLVANSAPRNDTEKQIDELMHSYKYNLGGGFHHSMADIMTSFSISLSLFLFCTGVLNLYLLKCNVDFKILKGVIIINIAAYTMCFITMVLLTFLLPIVCAGLVLLFLLLAWYIGSRQNTAG
jgi:hypothetical protein